MDKFIELFKAFTFTEVVMVIVLLILGLKGTAEILKTIKSDLETWYQKKRGIEQKEETLESRVSKLEESDKVQLEKLDQIEDSVQKLTCFLEETVQDRNRRLDEITESHKNAVVAQARASLYKISKDLDGRDYITSTEYEIFSGLSEQYLQNGGNSIFKNKIIPAIEALPIRND